MIAIFAQKKGEESYAATALRPIVILMPQRTGRNSKKPHALCLARSISRIYGSTASILVKDIAVRPVWLWPLASTKSDINEIVKAK